MCAYSTMHNACMQAHHSRMNLVHNHRHTHMNLVCHMIAYDTLPSRRVHMHKTRC